MIQKNAAKWDSAGAVCNSGMGMLFFNVFYFGGICKISFFWKGGLDVGKYALLELLRVFG